jgi:hypothetical protein
MKTNQKAGLCALFWLRPFVAFLCLLVPVIVVMQLWSAFGVAVRDISWWSVTPLPRSLTNRDDGCQQTEKNNSRRLHTFMTYDIMTRCISGSSVLKCQSSFVVGGLLSMSRRLISRSESDT